MMLSSNARAAVETEDPLYYLPCSTIQAYEKGQTIYGQDEQPGALYVVIDGIVETERYSNGSRTVLDIYATDEFFGYGGLLHQPFGFERAVALGPVKVMSWPVSEVEELIIKRPRLGLALTQLNVKRLLAFTDRLSSLATDSMGVRLARTLLSLAERLGTAHGDESQIRMRSFTHEMLAQWIGTSREIVSHYLNTFRRDGYIQYSRQSMLLDKVRLCEFVKRNG